MFSIQFLAFSVHYSEFSTQNSVLSVYRSLFSILYSAKYSVTFLNSAFSNQQLSKTQHSAFINFYELSWNLYSAFSIQHSVFSIQRSSFCVQYFVFCNFLQCSAHEIFQLLFSINFHHFLSVVRLI